MSSIDFGQRFKQAAAKPPTAFGKNATPGTTVYGRIAEIGEQPRLKFNGAPGEVQKDKQGNPVMQVYITLDTPAGLRNLYPTSRMERAIGTAMAKAGADQFAVGAGLSVTYTGTDPSDERARLYTAVYTPVAAPQAGA
ncbi:hypothetical protein [Nocardia huaxiensis]|uniref:Uncharacterized protein n=1 Tax=Nocardia huaxiensis TaxID=2755382 RepID=A0A7D6Z809_9NOCA|nr:hypothetical protein [Nocardia huaxiensis]QLY34004.1 hypothetical protein H0264_18770 [Nocardia huaxiensis]UFS99093.1 hypothetical protein LPY97_14940 [Nocardia huaxiensis]